MKKKKSRVTCFLKVQRMEEEPNQQEQLNISVFTPILYLVVLVSCFIAFSVIYRRRKVSQLSQQEPIFEENYSLNLYQYLKSQYTNDQIPKEEKPHEKVMKAALLRRGVEAIRRSIKLKENEQAFNKLYQEGLIGDEIFQQYAIQVKFQELDIKEIVLECESYKKNWSQLFFKVAQEICFNEALRRRLNAMDERASSLSTLWQYFADQSEKPSANIENIPESETTQATGTAKGKAKKRQK